MTEDKEWLTVKELAELTGLSRKTIDIYAREGFLHPVRGLNSDLMSVPKRHRRMILKYRVSDIEKVKKAQIHKKKKQSSCSRSFWENHRKS